MCGPVPDFGEPGRLVEHGFVHLLGVLGERVTAGVAGILRAWAEAQALIPELKSKFKRCVILNIMPMYYHYHRVIITCVALNGDPSTVGEGERERRKKKEKVKGLIFKTSNQLWGLMSPCLFS